VADGSSHRRVGGVCGARGRMRLHDQVFQPADRDERASCPLRERASRERAGSAMVRGPGSARAGGRERNPPVPLFRRERPGGGWLSPTDPPARPSSRMTTGRCWDASRCGHGMRQRSSGTDGSLFGEETGESRLLSPPHACSITRRSLRFPRLAEAASAAVRAADWPLPCGSAWEGLSGLPSPSDTRLRPTEFRSIFSASSTLGGECAAQQDKAGAGLFGLHL
jgi:hypothetical protein